jgi:hypothetical protein
LYFKFFCIAKLCYAHATLKNFTGDL